MIWIALFACHAPAPADDTAADRPAPDLGLCDGWSSDLLSPETIDEMADEPQEAAALGLAWDRPHRPGGHAFARNLVFPEDGTGPHWLMTDALVEQAQDAGISLFATLQPVATPGVQADVLPVMKVDDLETGYADYVRAVVERYDGDGVDDMPGLVRPIKDWEIGNEPVCPPDAEDDCLDDLLGQVRVTYETAKDADPGATVVAGGAAPVLLPDGSENARSIDLYTRFLDAGGLDWSDALDVHTGVGSAGPPIGAVLDWWDAHQSVDLPVWIGEMGTRSPGDQSRVSFDADDEADWLKDQIDVARERGVARVFWCVTGDLDRFPTVTDAVAAEADRTDGAE